LKVEVFLSFANYKFHSGPLLLLLLLLGSRVNQHPPAHPEKMDEKWMDDG
jgi:hypothetical protein